MVGLVCLDFDNLYPPGRALPSRDLVAHDLLMMSSELAHYSADEVHLRLYGGWTSLAGPSRRSDEVVQILPRPGFFPISLPEGRILRGSLELATQLIDLPADLGDTYVRRSGPPQIRLQQIPRPTGCQRDRDLCPAHILRSFTQRGSRTCSAPSCSVTSAQAFVTHEQKMVDTMIACDLLSEPHFAGRAADVLALVSGDRDFLPVALTVAARSKLTLIVIDAHAEWSQADRDLLAGFGIRVLALGEPSVA